MAALAATLFLLAACASSRETKQPKRAIPAASAYENRLTPEQQRAFNYYFLGAGNLKQQEKYDAAFEMYEHCLSIDSLSPAVFYELSQFYLFLNQKDKVASMLERAVAAEPDNFWYQQSLASAYEQMGAVDKTIALYEKMWQKYPQRSELLMQLVDLYGQNKQYKNAISALDRLEKIEGKAEEISLQKSRMYVALQDYDAAFKEMKDLAEQYPYDTRYRIMLGDLYLKNGRPTEAYQTYQDVLAQEPDNALAQLSLASYYDQMGEDSLCHNQLEELILNPGIESKTQVALMQQLVLQSEQKKSDTAQVAALFEKVMQMPQKDTEMAALYVKYLLYKGADEATVSPVLHKILEIEPENSDAQLTLLQYAIKRENYDEIYDLSHKAIQYNPDMIELYYFLGISCYMKKNYDEALDVFKKGAQIEVAADEENKQLLKSDIFSLMGDVYHEKGNEAATFEAYDSALVYNPDNITTLNNYAYYLSLKKSNLDKAEEMSFRVIQDEPKNSTYLDTYAWILFQKGRFAEAKLYIDSCIENEDTDNAVELEHAGDIYYLCGEKEKAVEFWERAVKAGSVSKNIQNKIKQKKYIP